MQTFDELVGKESIDRAMRIIDALLKAVERRGMKVAMVGEQDSGG